MEEAPGANFFSFFLFFPYSIIGSKILQGTVLPKGDLFPTFHHHHNRTSTGGKQANNKIRPSFAITVYAGHIKKTVVFLPSRWITPQQEKR